MTGTATTGGGAMCCEAWGTGAPHAAFGSGNDRDMPIEGVRAELVDTWVAPNNEASL